MSTRRARAPQSTGGATRRWYRVERLLVLSGLGLLPWLVVLARGLPATSATGNLVWIGLDALEALGLIATGLLADRGHRLHPLTATASATLLALDAWFDTMTAAPGADRVAAVAMACAAELPLAGVCVVVAARGMAGLAVKGAVREGSWGADDGGGPSGAGSSGPCRGTASGPGSGPRRGTASGTASGTAFGTAFGRGSGPAPCAGQARRQYVAERRTCPLCRAGGGRARRAGICFSVTGRRTPDAPSASGGRCPGASRAGGCIPASVWSGRRR